MTLSKRLQTIAELVRQDTVADIGTDHGYIPIFLHTTGRLKQAIACDINAGPLERARKNADAAGASSTILLRQGDGLLPIRPYEAKTAILAGMGGQLILSILKRSPEVVQSFEELILSPHLDIEPVRRYLHTIGFCIDTERMLVEDGKYYTVLRAVHGEEQYASTAEYRFGRCLLLEKNPVLKEYLQSELRRLAPLCDALKEMETKTAQQRQQQLLAEKRCIEEGLQWLSYVGIS